MIDYGWIGAVLQLIGVAVWVIPVVLILHVIERRQP